MGHVILSSHPYLSNYSFFLLYFLSFASCFDYILKQVSIINYKHSAWFFFVLYSNSSSKFCNFRRFPHIIQNFNSIPLRIEKDHFTMTPRQQFQNFWTPKNFFESFAQKHLSENDFIMRRVEWPVSFTVSLGLLNPWTEHLQRVHTFEHVSS